MYCVVLFLIATALPTEAFLSHKINARCTQRSVSKAVTASRGNQRSAAIISSMSINEGEEEVDVDVVVIGSGVGGLSAASLLAQYGKRVLVLEAHEHPG